MKIMGYFLEKDFLDKNRNRKNGVLSKCVEQNCVSLVSGINRKITDSTSSVVLHVNNKILPLLQNESRVVTNDSPGDISRSHFSSEKNEVESIIFVLYEHTRQYTKT